HAIVWKTPSSSWVANPDLILKLPDSAQRGIAVAADNYNRTRAHVFLFADHLLDVFFSQITKRLSRMFQQVVPLAGLAGRHCGRQIDQPLGVYCKAAHHFEGGDGVLFADGQIAMQSGLDDSL